MSTLQVSNNKTLKLTNVLKYKVNLAEDTKIDAQIEQMRAYIRIKGNTQIGPLIQYTRPYITESGEVEVEIIFLLQCSSFIHTVEAPYSMKSIIRVPDCMYVRYTGEEDKLKFAYDKISITAFEEDILLIGDSYTIFVEQQEGTMVADVFMPKDLEEI